MKITTIFLKIDFKGSGIRTLSPAYPVLSGFFKEDLYGKDFIPSDPHKLHQRLQKGEFAPFPRGIHQTLDSFDQSNGKKQELLNQKHVTS
ncbi:MAG: hypothetical protein IKU11_03640 [Clostridia bacterium]|nr:hypothetical protein [Clostridia bacterium]